MSPADVENLREGIRSIDPAVSHRARHPPEPSEIYAPDHHISALDPENPLVVGSRGAGKSFWAGALGDDTARSVLADTFPKLRLDQYRVVFGFTAGQSPTP